VTPATFARSLRQFGRRALVDLVALMGNYAGTAALLTAFDMQLDQVSRRLCRHEEPARCAPLGNLTRWAVLEVSLAFGVFPACRV
jgi:hypothetical protein